MSRPDSATPVVVGRHRRVHALAVQNVGADLDFQGASGDIDFDMAGDVTRSTFAIQEIVATSEGPQIIERERVSFP
ncbi:hypothetical protein [Vitiosangium sp. GDMCC 1.1324]|uniref:hypothetical protein n=1 Tax=Vitiosangium sp. (strain GDMCC 1.1324) TaxID=2138576 RepID=UPI0011B65305|nr:hypothetical protein [Vitiosangium sp. GDMCC 1.1324]